MSRQTSDNYRCLFDAAGDLIFVHDESLRVLAANRRATEMLGYSEAEFLSMTVPELDVPEEVPHIEERVAKLMRDGRVTFETSLRTKSGGTVPVEANVRLVEWDGKRAILSVGHDLRERRRAEAELDAERKRAEAYFELAGVMLVVLDREGRVSRVNRRGCEILGLPRDEILGRDWFASFVPAGARDRVRDVFRTIVSGEIEPAEFYENVVERGDGETRLIAWHNAVLRSPDGLIVGTLSSGEDITDRRRMETALAESERLLSMTQKISKVGGWEWDVAAATMRWTEETFRIHGMPDEGLGSGSFERIERSLSCYAEGDRELVRTSFLDCVREGKPYDITVRFTSYDGIRKWIRTVGTPVLADGKVARVVGNIMDVTERKEAEDRIAALLREKELLLKETHHRIKNNMSTIASLLSLQSGASGDPRVSGALSLAVSRVRGMMALYDRLYRSSNYREIAARPFLESVVGEILGVLDPDSRVAVRIEADDAPLDAAILTPLAIALNELITNSVKYAFADGRRGTVSVSASSGAETLELGYADDGPGLPPGMSPGRSGGFGLNLVSMLADQMDATVEFGPPPGMSLKLRIPLGRR